MDDNHIKDIHNRFDRIESKIDEYAKHTIEHKQDITWIKGYIKVGLSAVTAIAAAIIGAFVHMFSGK